MFDKDKIISKLIGNPFDTQTEGEHITVAELKTIDKNGLKETIDINTALVSPSLINKIKSSHVNPYVNLSGAYYREDYEYKPSFSLYLSKSSGLSKAEPLVVSWCSGNHTTFMVDQGFLSAFKLSPRLLDSEILWDDLKEPQYDIVKIKPLSEYKFPTYSEAYVKIKKDYLETYLAYRKKAAVQIFTIKRDIVIDEEISTLLKNKKHFIEEFKQLEIRISRFDNKKDTARLEINGFKLLLENSGNNEKEETGAGHYWKGIDGLVTEWRARHEMPFEYVYVSDKVLAVYETDEDYEVHPLSGSVSYRNQWAVTHCDRVGKNAIKIEIKKLYEGNGYTVIDYWNKFSIHPSEIIEGENIAEKAERLIRKFFLFGRILTNLFNGLLELNYLSKDLISLDEECVEYTGWSGFSEFNAIAQHVDLKYFSKEQFISRCKKLYIILGENLKEKPLRKIVDMLGFPASDTEKLRSIKLLELIIAYIKVTEESGLDPLVNKDIIVKRVLENKSFNALLELSAVNSIRQLDAHKANDSKARLHKAMIDLGVEPNSISNNYSDACWQAYDSLDKMFLRLNVLFSN
ncbi:hypothetical protein SAMN06265171_103397 [Chryseobacterium rhizoplanae]|uniref:Uncharacterized protein n=1 Tax=Chryseobacterium rhizoplanae TaxID=1609531 RepID=A0A521CUI7_9FLAO|nr:hypothetical protein [Chryseobacterium rhizoplanae]SMO63117.1 hypothetical protein SAMN06265171_103397 [Chryseobacterium rhizoplanae]